MDQLGTLVGNPTYTCAGALVDSPTTFSGFITAAKAALNKTIVFDAPGQIQPAECGSEFEPVVPLHRMLAIQRTDFVQQPTKCDHPEQYVEQRNTEYRDCCLPGPGLLGLVHH